LLVSIGISGAWIGTLTKLAPYQPIFLGLAAVSIGAGFWMVYGRQQVACEGAACATSASGRVSEATLWLAVAVKAALWLAAVILAAAASADWWARLLA
jgi:mercuric ion transport protein